MSDRELLTLAAKAAGLTLKPFEIKNVTKQGDDRFCGYMTDADQWPRGWFDPLTDDGDALRLAVRLELTVVQNPAIEQVEVCNDASTFAVYEGYKILNRFDPATATRRAITRAAAEIGRNMT